MRRPLTLAICAAAGLGMAVGWSAPGHADDYVITPAVLDRLTAFPGELAPLPSRAPAPADNATTVDRARLGKMLFFDTRLSGDGHVSCATCHNPAFGWSDGLPRTHGFSAELGRHAPTVLNAAFSKVQFWDGRAPTLETQAGGPLTAPVEMGSTPQKVEAVVRGIPAYRLAFKQAYGAEPNFQLVTKAIAAYERTLITPESRYDRYLRGDKKALSLVEKRGMAVYVGKGNCAACHNGPALTDSAFYNLGTPQLGPQASDAGRFEVTKVAADMMAFKTPTLRNIALTAPYMHDGAFRTLEEVVAFYDRGGIANPHRSELIQPLGLSATDRQDLVAFLKTLTGKLPDSSVPQLPY